MDSLNGFVHFLTYVGASFATLYIFIQIFILSTPVDDVQKIRDNDISHALILGGASLGFTIPLLFCSLFGTSIIVFIELALIVGAVQLLLEKLISYWLVHKNEATAIFHAFISICVGLIMGFSIIP